MRCRINGTEERGEMRKRNKNVHPDRWCSICGKERTQKYCFFDYSYQFYGCFAHGRLALCTECTNKLLKPIDQMISESFKKKIQKFEVKGILVNDN